MGGLKKWGGGVWISGWGGGVESMVGRGWISGGLNQWGIESVGARVEGAKSVECLRLTEKIPGKSIYGFYSTSERKYFKYRAQTSTLLWTGNLELLRNIILGRFFSEFSANYFWLCEMNFRILAVWEQNFYFVCLRPNTQFSTAMNTHPQTSSIHVFWFFFHYCSKILFKFLRNTWKRKHLPLLLTHSQHNFFWDSALFFSDCR